MAWVEADKTTKPFSGGPYSGAQILYLSEEETGDQDKTLSFNTDILGMLPNAAAAEVLTYRLEYTAAAGGSARVARCDVLDAEDDIVGGFGTAQSTAADTTREYTYGCGLDQTAATTPDHERLPRNLVLLPGMSLNFTASNSAAGDNMILHVTVAVYS
jgi:hypothetical protein